MVLRLYNVWDWYWHVQDVDKIWGSRAESYLTPSAPGVDGGWDAYQAFLADGALPTEVPTEPDMWRFLNDTAKTIWTPSFVDVNDSGVGAVYLMFPPVPSSTNVWFGNTGSKLVLYNARTHRGLPIGVPIEVKNIGAQDFEIVTWNEVPFSPPLALSATDTVRLTLADNGTEDGVWTVQLNTRSQTLAFAQGILGRSLSATQWRVAGRYVLMAADGTTKAMRDIYPVEPTLDISVVGAGGRYESAPYPSVFGAVNVFVIWGPGKDLTCFSTAGVNDVWGVWARLPVGYTHACLVSVFEVDGSGHLPAGLEQIGNIMFYDPILVVNADAYSSAVPNKPVDLSPWAPHAMSVFFNVWSLGNATSSDYSVFGHTLNKAFAYIGHNSRSSFEMPMDYNNAANLGKPMLYYGAQGATTIWVSVTGYRILGVM